MKTAVPKIPLVVIPFKNFPLQTPLVAFQFALCHSLDKESVMCFLRIHTRTGQPNRKSFDIVLEKFARKLYLGI